MQNRAMTNVTIALDNTILTRERVHDTGILHIGTLRHDNAAKIAPERCVGTDIAVRSNDDIANQNRGFMYKRVRMNNGCETFKTVNGHLPETLQVACRNGMIHNYQLIASFCILLKLTRRNHTT